MRPSRAPRPRPAISLSPLFAARRCRLSRCSTLSRSAITSSSSSASRSPVGIGRDAAVVERAQHDRGSRRSCAALPSDLGAEALARLRARAAARGARARSPRRTTFFDFDISASAVEPLVGQARDADRGLVLAGHGQAGQGAEQPVRARTRETDETEVLHRGAGYRSASLHPLMSKKTKKRKLKARRNKANHGKRPRAGR